ncbi:DinB family protein [Isosphaeraceae bacterium EP7]
MMPAQDLAVYVDDLARGYDGDAWHGPPLRKVLEGVTAEIASARPIPGGHSIRQIVVHLYSWDDVVVRRIEENCVIEAPDGGNFPPPEGTGPDAWQDDLSRLDLWHARLLKTVLHLDASRLESRVAGKEYTIGHMLRGAVQHMAYHGGQIALLRKLSERGTDG